MTLPELINEVYNVTGRADRVNETLSAIKSAVLSLHQSDYFYKDIFETGILLSPVAYVQDLDYRTLLPLFRAHVYLRKYDLASGTPGDMFDLVSPGNVFDDYKIQKQNICYVAGSVIHVNSSTLDTAYLWGAYVNPNVTVDNFNSWIALDYPYAIVYKAASIVFKAIGKDEEAAAFLSLVTDPNTGLLKDIKASNIQAQGF